MLRFPGGLGEELDFGKILCAVNSQIRQFW